MENFCQQVPKPLGSYTWGFTVCELALTVAADFSHLAGRQITWQKHFRLKQIVTKLTRKDTVLDLVLTNMHEYCEDPCSFPSFGLSDHKAITADATMRDVN